MKKVHKIRLEPTVKQLILFHKSAGVARFSYNWALAKWQELYEAGEKTSEISLRKQLNSIKRVEFPWMYEVSKTCPQQAIKNLGNAFSRFFKKTSKYPKFKKKGIHDSFRADDGPGTFTITENRIKLSKIGSVKLSENLRFTGKLISATVTRRAKHWYVSVCIETEINPITHENQGVVGVDLGIESLAVLSNSVVFENPNALRRNLHKLKRIQRSASRKVKGSYNRKKAMQAVASLHAKIYFLRQDSLHKLTTHLAKGFKTIVIEDLNVKGMVKNHHLAQAIFDCGFGEFRRQLTYKCQWYGSELVVADRFFASSKICSSCSFYYKGLTLNIREWTCPCCGTIHDRDYNASKNLEQIGRVPPELTPVETEALACNSVSETTVVEAGISPMA